MSEQDQEHTKILFAIMITNGLLSRLDPKEIDPVDIWELADALMEAKNHVSAGLPPIKRRRKHE